MAQDELELSEGEATPSEESLFLLRGLAALNRSFTREDMFAIGRQWHDGHNNGLGSRAMHEGKCNGWITFCPYENKGEVLDSGRAALAKWEKENQTS